MRGAIRSRLKSLLSIPGNLLIASASQFDRRVHRAVRSDASIASQFVPFRATERSWMIPLPTSAGDDGPLPLPPPELWLRYGRSADQYLASGRSDVEAMRRILEQAGAELAECRRILDFGCGAGRMMRWLVDLRRSEIWGADFSADHVLWCGQHLSPPFRFVTTTSCPHLPFEDNYFDLIYAGSVFTHISDLADTWLLELRRVLRPGGWAYVTIHDEHTVAMLAADPGRPLAREIAAAPPHQQFWKAPFGMFTLGRGGGSQVFYDREFVRRSWGRVMDVVSIVPEAYARHQSAVVLAKRSG